MSRLLDWFARAVIVGCATVALSIAVSSVVPVLAILANFGLYALIGSLAALAIVSRSTGRAWPLAAIFVAALNGAWVIPSMIGRSATSHEAGPTTKLFVFNMWWNNQDLAAVKELIAQTDPDIIVLLEVSDRSRPDLRALDAAYPYRVECWTSLPCDALILSRKALTEQTTTTELDGVRLGVARTGFDLNGCPVTLFAAHLNRPWPYHSRAQNSSQDARFTALAAAVRQWPGPKIVVGDLNATPWTHGVQQLADAANGKPLGGVSGTWPWFLPAFLKLPIDHVIVSRPTIVASRMVLASTGSDHSPVLATLSLPDPALCKP